jgi:D-sedoheptulose 7-phosphate isomerase
MSALLDTIRRQHTEALDGFFAQCGDAIEALAGDCAAALGQGNKLLFCGNGGSACDAMHIAGEFVGRFVDDRRALPALALSADTGLITAIANDYAYDYIFARQVEGLGVKGDILIALSTSGSSPNVVKAIEAAKKKGILTVLFTGEKGRENKAGADKILIVPSKITAHVQEAHMVGLHGLAGLIEKQLF